MGAVGIRAYLSSTATNAPVRWFFDDFRMLRYDDPSPSDPASRLDEPSGESYRYDLIGNLKSKAGVSYSYGTNGNGTGSGPHQARTVGGQSYTYDANGNLLSGGGRSYTWNSENQPSSITGPDGVREDYTYDAEGMRVTRARGNVTTIYLGGMVEEEGGTTRRHYAFGGQVVAQRSRTNGQDTVIYLHSDHLGSIAVATSSTGALVRRQEFTPWGEVRRIVDVFAADLQGNRSTLSAREFIVPIVGS